ncbi:restriction endonuclease subunit S [Acinetobacter baumannii]|uniref:restriction endonuclease subunit S n=1 Tax=Acinetobacter baumannii TaxID=470 RepID=UPI002341106B|nr:restriction endonuclease subunit S [Acinetobacter baumannii]
MSQFELSEVWETSELSSIVNFIDYRGKTPTKTSEGIPLITAKNIRDGYINREPREFIAEDAYDSWMTRGFPQLGDLVITTEAPMGNVAVLDIQEKFALAQRAICLSFVKEPRLSKFIYYYLRSQSFKSALVEKATGTTVQGIKAAELKKIPVPIAPLAEQKIIADKLDTLLAQVESIKARLERIPEILKQFRQSVLTAAVSGKLFNQDEKYKSITVEDTWFHVVEGRKHWQQYKFSEVVKIVGGSQPPKAEFRYEPMEGYIRLIQIRDYKSDDHKVFIPRKLAKRFVTKDDVMIGRYGPPIFQILRGLEGAYNVALMKAEPNKDLIDREYLFWFLQNSQIYNYIEAGSDRTAGQSGVNKKHLESYPIFLPPLSEQIEIVAKVKNLFACSDMIEQQVQSALDRVNNLTQSILAKAFRGELTAEWREANPELISGENSAEALLKRIKAERESAKPTTKRGRAKT